MTKFSGSSDFGQKKTHDIVQLFFRENPGQSSYQDLLEA